MLILSLIEERPRHGYEILKLLEERSGGVIKFHIGSMYPILFRLDQRGWIRGEWQSEKGSRRRREYRITAAGRAVLKSQRGLWRDIVAAISRVAKTGNA